MVRNNFVILLLIMFLLVGSVSAAVPQTLNLQGKLTDNSGSVLTGNYNMTFRIYDVVAGGSSLYTSPNNSVVTDSNGVYNFILNDVNLPFDTQYYLGILVGEDGEMVPRINLTSSPYAFKSNETDFVNPLNNYEMQNLTLAEKITFTLGEMIDNIVDGWIAITGSLNVSGSLNVTGDIFSNGINVSAWETNVSKNYTLDTYTNWNDAWTTTYNATYDAYKTNVSKNYTLDTYTNWNDAWTTTYNATYAKYNDTALIGAVNTTFNIQSLLNDTNMKFENLNVTGNLSLGKGRLMFNDTSKRYDYYNGSTWKDMSMGNVPAGAIMAFNSATCPTGWIPADGTSGTPDLRGIFVRGAGISSMMKYANGTFMSATYGEYLNDSFQGHFHDTTRKDSEEVSDFLGGSSASYGISSSSSDTNINFVFAPKSDGVNSDPRTGAETRPASYALTYCMKTTEDSETSNTIWGESGGDIVLNNASKSLKINNTNFVVNVTSGNVGIGTDSPNAPLEVSGAGSSDLFQVANFFTTTDDYNTYFVIGKAASAGRSGVMGFVDNTDTTSGYIWLSNYGDAVGIDGITIKKGGNVGIGTVAPTEKFEVSGGNMSIQTTGGAKKTLKFKQGGIVDNEGRAKIDVIWDGSSEWYMNLGTNDDFSTITLKGGAVGIGTDSPTVGIELDVEGQAECDGAGCWTVESDIAYKRDIVDLDYGLDEILKIQPKRYILKDTGEVGIGMIAQEVDDIIPELVYGEDGGKSIGYGGFAPVLINAIQELKALYDAQQVEIQSQKTEIDLLKTSLCNLGETQWC